MTDKIREIKKAVLRLMLALAIGVLAGAAPGAVLISHAGIFRRDYSADPLCRCDCRCDCCQYGGGYRRTGRRLIYRQIRRTGWPP